MEAREFTLFEEEAGRFIPSDYHWSYTKQKNLEGRERNADVHRFTWQFHGGQFTVIRDVPASAKRFKIEPDVPVVDQAAVLKGIGFREDWIKIV